MLGGNDAQTLERQTRANKVAELPPSDGARLREQERAVSVLHPRRRFFGEIEHAAPIARLLAVGLAQEEERPFVLGIEFQRFFEKASADVDVLVPQHPAGSEGERHGAPSLRIAGLL